MCAWCLAATSRSEAALVVWQRGAVVPRDGSMVTWAAPAPSLAWSDESLIHPAGRPHRFSRRRLTAVAVTYIWDFCTDSDLLIPGPFPDIFTRSVVVW